MKKKKEEIFLILFSVEYKKCNLRGDTTGNLEIAVDDKLLLVLTRWSM